MKIFIHDHIIPEEQAHISLHDRGLLLGDGLFETLKADHGHIHFFDAHYTRLKKSADLLFIPWSLDSEQLRNRCQQLLVANALDKSLASLRITLTRGISQRGITIPKNQHPTILITAAPYSPPDHIYPRIFITTIQRNSQSPITRLKTLNYLEPILARQEAQRQGFDDGLMLNTERLVAECSTANIFFIKDEKIMTPRLENGILPGITRDIVITLCKKNQIPLIEKDITPTEALESDGAFQTNSLVGVQPLSSINNVVLSSHHAPLIQAVMQLYAHDT